MGVCETAPAADLDEDEEFEGIFSILGSLFGSMWPSMSPQAEQVEAWMRRRERIILLVLKSSITNQKEVLSQNTELLILISCEL